MTCDDCGITEEDGGDISPKTITPHDDPDHSYESDLCESCVVGYEEGNDVT